MELFSALDNCIFALKGWSEQKGNTFRCSMEFRKQFTHFIELASRFEINLSSHFQYLCEKEASMRKNNFETVRIFKDYKMDIIRYSEYIVHEINYKQKMNLDNV